MRTIWIQLQNTSQPIEHHGVINTYQKGDLYCVYCEGEMVYKYPIITIWRIKEEYGEHQTPKEKTE